MVGGDHGDRPLGLSQLLFSPSANNRSKVQEIQCADFS